jgi:hypothetical protein
MKWILLAVVLCLSTSLASAATFKGYQCTQDCSGHKAGYEWAMKKRITDKSNCTGNSQSFREGCYAWVDEQKRKRK